MATIDVLIIGAGPVGMAMALELSLQGISFRIVDKAAQRSDKSRALGVHSRTMELLSRYSDAEMSGLLSKANRISGNAIWFGGKRFDGFDGSPQVVRRGLGDSQYPGIFSVAQVHTEEFLEGRLRERGVVVERPVSVASISQDADGVTVVLSGGEHAGGEKDKNEEGVVRCKYVVGCDGAHSVVRHSMDVRFDGDAYPQEYILADAEYEWKDLENKAHIFIGDGMAMIIPMKDGIARFIASRPRHGREDEDPTLQDLRDAVESQLPEGASTSRPVLTKSHWLARFHLHHRCATSYRDGRLFIAGDAAHIHSPIGGQGMNTGIQDSVNLGWKLASVLRGERPEALLDTYHEERWPVGQHLLRQTDQLFTLLSSTDPTYVGMRNMLLPYALPTIGANPAAGLGIMRYLAQLDVKYRRSSIVRTAGGFEGPIRGGYRAPDGQIRTAEGRVTFLQDLFRGTGHHLVLFSTEEDSEAVEKAAHKLGGTGVSAQVHIIGTASSLGSGKLVDVDGELHERYGFESRSGYALVRPDGYVASIGYVDDLDDLAKWLATY